MSATPTLSSRILSTLQSYPDGLTPEKLATVLNEDVTHIRPRLTALKKKKLVRETGQTERPEGQKRRSKVIALATAEPTP